MKKNLYNDSPNEYDVIPQEQTDYIKKLQAHLVKLDRHRTNVDRVVASIKEAMSKLDPSGHAKLIGALEQLIGEDQASISEYPQDDRERARREARQDAYNSITNATMNNLAKGLGLLAKISLSSGDNETNLDRMIESLLPQSERTPDMLTLGNITYDDVYDELIKSITIMMEYYKRVQITEDESDGYADLAESLGIEYYNLNDFGYYNDLSQAESLVYRRTGENLKTIKPTYTDIALLNIMNGVIVRFCVTEHDVTGDKDATSYTVNYVKRSQSFSDDGDTMPAGMFRIPEKDMTTLQFLGGVTYGTTDLKYEKSDRNEIIGPEGSPPLLGIDKFDFVGELGNVSYLFNIREIYDRQSVTADVYGNSPYSLPDTVEGQPKTSDPAMKNAYTGSMAKYLAHSSKVMSRSRGKLYCIFYMHGYHPVAADEKNIYELDEALYAERGRALIRNASSTRAVLPTSFKSGENNTWYLPDGYTLNALRYILNVSKIDLTGKFINEKGGAGTRSGPLHTSSTFLTVTVVRPCDLFYKYDRHLTPSYDVKIIKSNIFPNLRLHKVVNHSRQYTVVNPRDGIITICDDPLWVRFFSIDKAIRGLEVREHPRGLRLRTHELHRLLQ